MFRDSDDVLTEVKAQNASSAGAGSTVYNQKGNTHARQRCCNHYEGQQAGRKQQERACSSQEGPSAFKQPPGGGSPKAQQQRTGPQGRSTHEAT